MAQPGVVDAGPQLPPDSTGKLTGAFVDPANTNTAIYLPATVLVDNNGFEVGSILITIITLLQEMAMELKRTRFALEILIEESIPEDIE